MQRQQDAGYNLLASRQNAACNVIISAGVLHRALWLEVANYAILLSCVHSHSHQQHANQWGEMHCCTCQCNMVGHCCKRQHRAVTQCYGLAAGKEVQGLWKNGWARRPLQVDKAQADLLKRHLTLKLLHPRLLSQLQNDSGTPFSDLFCFNAAQIVMHVYVAAAPRLTALAGAPMN